MSAVTATASTETSCQPLWTDEDEAPCVTSGVMRSAKSTVVPCDGQDPAASHRLATEHAPTLTGISGGVRRGRQLVGIAMAKILAGERRHEPVHDAHGAARAVVW